jgi:uncharacterized membrane protein YhiD involved in acid resistance
MAAPLVFRTHLLVGVASCLMMIVSEYVFKKYGDLSSNITVRLDPARVAAQIVDDNLKEGNGKWRLKTFMTYT